MEGFAIILSLPGGLFIGFIYAIVARALTSEFRWLIKPVLYTSIIILVCLVSELVLLATFGAVRSRSLLGPPFSLIHFINFVLGAPALANVLVVPRRMYYQGHQIVAGMAFGLMFTILVILQYCVSEALYGVNGDSGPFSLLPENSIGSGRLYCELPNVRRSQFGVGRSPMGVNSIFRNSISPPSACKPRCPVRSWV
jgi:hypothetical protein